MTDFGDFTPDDAYDSSGHAEPFQVARFLHDELHDLGAPGPRWADLDGDDQEIGEDLMADLLPYEQAHAADPIAGAHHLQDVRHYLDPLDADAWDDLDPEEQQLAIDLVRDVLAWLVREGTALT